MAKSLKPILPTLEGLPEALHDFYEKVGDHYVLQADEKDYTSKVAEFRNNNIKLMKEKEELQKTAERFKGIDPTKAEEAMAALRKIQEKEYIEKGEIDKLVELRTQTMREQSESATRALQQARDAEAAKASTYHSELTRLKIDSAATEAVSKVGRVIPTAMPDVVRRARDVFKIDDKGQLVAEGKFNAKGDPLTLDDWARDLTTTAAHCFEPAKGGGGGGGAPPAGGSGEKVVQHGDREGFRANLENIASGKVKVVGGPTGM